MACATGAAADSFEEGFSAYQRGDYAQAMTLWRPLAAQGHARAQYNLGVMYGKGQGVPQDAQEAVKWYRRATEQGYAQFNLGLSYELGHGVSQDVVRAYMWYSVAVAVLSGDMRKDAMERRDEVVSHMTAAQIANAQEMARRCQETKFKECG